MTNFDYPLSLLSLPEYVRDGLPHISRDDADELHKVVHWLAHMRGSSSDYKTFARQIVNLNLDQLTALDQALHERLNGEPAIPSRTPETVKVRIAVAVGADGSWNSAGWSSEKIDDSSNQMQLAVEGTNAEAPNTFWLTAVLPIPDEIEVEAGIEPA